MTVSQGFNNVEKLRDIVSARSYGSRLATTPGADINLAIDAAYNAGGMDVYVPHGSWQVETSLLQKTGVHLHLSPGCVLNAKTGLNAPVVKNATAPSPISVTGITRSGITATATTSANHGYTAGKWVHLTGSDQVFDYEGWKLILTTPTTASFTFECDKDATTPATGSITCFQETENNIGIHGGRIEGNAANTTGSNNGVQWNGVQNWTLEDLHVNATYHTGIAVYSGVNGKVRGCRSDNIINTSHTGFGFGATSPDFLNCDRYSVSQSFATQNGQDGFLHQWGTDAVYSCNIATGNTQTGLKLGNGHNVTYVGNVSKLNGSGFKAQNIFRNISYTANIAEANDDSGFYFSVITTTITCSKLNIVGNQSNDNGNDPVSSSYGYAFDVAAGGTIDIVNLVGNTCRGNARGVSFGTLGTVSNVAMHCNMGGDNTNDVLDAGSLDTATFTYGLNSFANASGIKLPANSASGINVGNTANTDATFLDYYGEGSWTPVLTFVTPGDLAVVYSQQVGRYTRIGDTVFLWCNILTSTFTHATASGNLRITGLPFTALNLSNFTQLGGGLGWSGVTKANYTDLNPYILPNTAIINVAASGSGQALDTIDTADMPTGGTVQMTFQLAYKV